MPLRDDVADFIRNNHLGVLSTISPDGEPQGALIDFFENDGYIYFVTRRNSRKFESLRKNHSIALTISRPEEWSSMQIQGSAERLVSEEETKEVTDALQKNPHVEDVYTGASKEPFQVIEGTAYEAYRITISWLRWLHKDKEGNPIFEQVIE